MPQGLSKITQANAASEARRAAGGSGNWTRRLDLKEDGATALVRFLEQGEDVWSVYTHQLSNFPGRSYGPIVQCLDQENRGEPCPGCSRNKTRSERITINVIWYDAPKFDRELADKDGKPGKVKKDSNGRVLYVMAQDASGLMRPVTEPVVATWNAPLSVSSRLDYLQGKLGGLLNSTFTIIRRGTGTNTKWDIDIEEKESPPTPEDLKLYEAKPDPRIVIDRKSWADMEKDYSGATVVVTPETAEAMADNAYAKAAGAVNRGAFG